MPSSDNLVKTTEGGKRRRVGVSMITNISMRGVLFVWLVIRITW